VGSDVRALKTEFVPTHPSIGVLALVPDPWESWWQTRHQVLSRLASRFPVVWVEDAAGWRDVIKTSQSRTRGFQESGVGGLTIYRPEAWLPLFHRPQGLANLTFGARLKRARQRLTALGVRSIVLHLWRPTYASALELVPHDFSCYHIDDEYTWAESEEPTGQAEAALIRTVDCVIVQSRTLLEKKGRLNSRTSLVPNGVDYRAYAAPHEEPEDLASIPHPRIGYTGILKRQVDWDIVTALVRRHGDWSFVFVGPLAPHDDVRATVSALALLRNVHFLGPKSVTELSRYPQHFDVCLMPYRPFSYTMHGYPLKLHEYLASGKPAVGTRIPALEEFAAVVELAGTLDEWSAGIRRSLDPAARSPEVVERRRAVARQHDWDHLVGRIATVFLEGVEGGLRRERGEP